LKNEFWGAVVGGINTFSSIKGFQSQKKFHEFFMEQFSVVFFPVELLEAFNMQMYIMNL
jgi:hypothetical protein